MSRRDSGAERHLSPEQDHEAILCQIMISFGQGTGAFRISRPAALALRERYQSRVTAKVQDDWSDQGSQALERIRAVGRLAAQLANSEGLTTIGADQVDKAAQKVEKSSNTGWCNHYDPG